MSINKLSHLKEGDKIYLEVTRKINKYYDDDASLFFGSKEDEVWVSDEDTFYTLDELKQLANDGMPKQGDEVEVKDSRKYRKMEFIAFRRGQIIVIDPEIGKIYVYSEWRFPKQKTELTLAEVEERLGLDAGSLIIK